jgi:hypothetical protein
MIRLENVTKEYDLPTVFRSKSLPEKCLAS